VVIIGKVIVLFALAEIDKPVVIDVDGINPLGNEAH
jgi:hypothetical protein